MQKIVLCRCFYLSDNSVGRTKTLKRSDFDFMVYDNDVYFPVGFNPDQEKDIRAVIETDQTQPGYLRLRSLLHGEYLVNDKTEHCIEQNFSSYCDIFFIYTPVQKTSLPDITHTCSIPKCDMVPYYPCYSWPPQANSWIDCKRHSNWPTTETINKIVKKRMCSCVKSSSVKCSTKYRISIFFLVC